MIHPVHVLLLMAVSSAAALLLLQLLSGPAPARPLMIHRPALSCLLHRHELLTVGGWQVPVHLVHGERPAVVHVFDLNGRPLWDGSAAEAVAAQIPARSGILVGVTTDAGNWQIKKVIR